MLRFLVAFGLLLSGVAGAQSLEQSYASLCSGAKKSSETCRTLRQALMDKLAKDDSSGPAIEAAEPRPAAARGTKSAAFKKGVVSPKWGLWAKLAGVTTIDEDGGAVRSYSWAEKGRVLELERLGREDSGISSFTMLDSGEIEVRPPTGAAYAMTPSEDGTFVAANSDTRWRYALSGTKMVVSEEKPDGSAWKPTGTVQVRRIIASSEIAAAKSKVNAERMAFAADVTEKWGIIGQSIGRRYLIKGADPKADGYGAWKWVEPGKVAKSEFYHVADGKSYAWDKIVRDPATGQMVGSNSAGAASIVSFEGKVANWSFPKTAAREEMRRHDTFDGTGFTIETYTVKKGKKRDASTYRFDDVSSAEYADIVADHNRRMAAITQKKAAERRAEAAAPKKKGGGGFLGALGGAMIGAMAGGDTSQILGAAAKGAAMIDPSSASAGALNTIGDTMISGGVSNPLESALGNAVAGGSSGATGTASANGHPYDNLAEGSCGSLMTLQNYRTNALSGGNDVQLKTLCGQAYEYYAMYKRAITQGYGHDDLMRTYNAHKDASAVVNQFYAEAR